MTSLFGRRSAKIAAAACVVAAGMLAFAAEKQGPQQPWSKWHVHDMERPAPPIVTPGTASTADKPGKPPSDAIVLFDGTDLSKWQAQGGGEPTFKVVDGAALSYGPKYLESKEKFGDVQLHIEWAEPVPAKGDSQGRGNSGVFLMGQFEVQVLDNYNNPTYPDGQCSAVYGQYPPEVNVCRPPGEWQTYDIIFHRPIYKDGKLAEPAYETVLQNGVLTQDHQRIEGPTGHMIVAKYPDKFPDKGPIALQYHGNPVKFRNIWVRPLESLEHLQQTGEVAGKTEEKK
ncbi:MAG TPA: DUF1080 domain-containing protein [Tepidisphaeraceae bacterium]|jgi:hypothetical protein|nr:DUF1080 domain-containing protein [Tepidisphaeraceae bacterium]